MTQLTDAHLAVFAHLVAQSGLPEEERKALLSAIILARKPALQFRPVDGAHLTNGGRWDYDGAGRWILHLAANNPSRWLDLTTTRIKGAATRSHSGWHNMIARAVESLRKVDPDLAKGLDTAGEPNAPGLHLRTFEGRVQVMWRPGPGVAVGVGVKVA